MDLLSDAFWAEIKPVFARAFPREGIVAIWPDGTWRELENVHPQPTHAFRLNEADDALLIEHEPMLFLHSHPNGQAWPSDRDTENQIATGWPWGIVAVDGNAAGQVYAVHYPEIWGPDAPVPPLEGRSYLWGIRDCWTLCWDYYRQQGLHLPPLPRVKQPGAHHTDPAKVNQITHWVRALNFTRVDRAERRASDIALMKWSSPVVNHMAIYLEESRYLHQPEKGLSTTWQVPHEDKFMERMAVEYWRPPCQ